MELALSDHTLELVQQPMSTRNQVEKGGGGLSDIAPSDHTLVQRQRSTSSQLEGPTKSGRTQPAKDDAKDTLRWTSYDHSPGQPRRAASHIKNPWNIQEERQGEAKHLGPGRAQLILESINVSSAAANWDQLIARTAHITLIQEHCLTEALAKTFALRAKQAGKTLIVGPFGSRTWQSIGRSWHPMQRRPQAISYS